MQKDFDEDYANIEIEGVVLGPNNDEEKFRVQWELPDRSMTTH